MKSYIILTAAGRDRPGLVDEVSAYLDERGMNIESSRMAVLGGEFAMIVLASGEQAEADRLASDPAALASATGLTVTAKKTSPPAERKAPASLPYRISAAGMDHQGIVHEISRLLHQHQVNIESMDTNVAPAPVSGAPIFSMHGAVSVPAEVKARKLREKLEELGEELNVDVEFEPEG